MGGGKESIEIVNKYKMNKQKQPLSGSVDGKKEQSHNIKMSLEVHEDETAYLGREGGDKVDEKSK